MWCGDKVAGFLALDSGGRSGSRVRFDSGRCFGSGGGVAGSLAGSHKESKRKCQHLGGGEKKQYFEEK